MKPVIVSLFDTAIRGVFQSAIWECTPFFLKSIHAAQRLGDALDKTFRQVALIVWLGLVARLANQDGVRHDQSDYL